MVLSNEIDLLHPSAELDKRKHKLKRLVQSLFHGFEVPGMLQHYHRFQSIADCGDVPKLSYWFVPAYQWKSPLDRGVLFQEERRVNLGVKSEARVLFHWAASLHSVCLGECPSSWISMKSID